MELIRCSFNERRLWKRFKVSRLGSYRAVIVAEDGRRVTCTLEDFGAGGIGGHVMSWDADPFNIGEKVYIEWCDLKPVMDLAVGVPCQVKRSSGCEVGLSFLQPLKIMPEKLQEIYQDGKKKMETDLNFFVWNLFC